MSLNDLHPRICDVLRCVALWAILADVAATVHLYASRLIGGSVAGEVRNHDEERARSEAPFVKENGRDHDEAFCAGAGYSLVIVGRTCV